MFKKAYFWDLFEDIFGANKTKKKLYREVFSRKGRILDFGCATGNTTGTFLDFDYYGLDINRKFIERAKKKWMGYNNIHFVCADLLTKPFSNSFFDFILFAGTGHHLKDDQVVSLMPEFYNILKPGGTLHFFDTLGPKTGDSLIAKWLVSIDRGKYVRDRSKWLALFRKEPRFLILAEKVFPSFGTLFPQPNYIYFKLGKPKK